MFGSINTRYYHLTKPSIYLIYGSSTGQIIHSDDWSSKTLSKPHHSSFKSPPLPHHNPSTYLSTYPFTGYILAVVCSDLVGRKPIQFLGFLLTAACCASCAGTGSLLNPNDVFGTRIYTNYIINIIGWVFIYAMTFLFLSWGPLTTCFIIPAEVLSYSTFELFNSLSLIHPLTHH